MAGALGCVVVAEPARDVLLVTVDTLRADYLGAYGSDRDLTPHLDALAGESVVFERAYALAPQTLPSITALLTGRPPESLQITTNGNRLRTRIPTLATVFRDRGYRTGAVVGSFVLRREVGLARGFEIYDDTLDSEERVRSKPERVGDDTTEAALGLLRQFADSPERGRFVWIHYQDPHGPYTPPPGFREAELSRERQSEDGARRLARGEGEKGLGEIPHYQYLEPHDVAWYRAGYAGEIRFLDQQIGRLLETIEAESLLDDPIIVFTSDHGEAMGERDYWFAHGEYLIDSQVRVPLLIRAPGLVPGRRPDAASLLDVLPTLRRLVGAAKDAKLTGRDLVDPAEAPIVLNTFQASTRPGTGLVLGDRKYVRSVAEGQVREELFALGEDGSELVRDEPDRVDSLREKLLELRGGDSFPEAPAAPAPSDLSDDERESLRALGYVL